MENFLFGPAKPNSRSACATDKRGRNNANGTTHPAHVIDPTQSFRDTFTLIDVRAESSIILRPESMGDSAARVCAARKNGKSQ